LKPWITPSIFENTGNVDIIDEYTFGQYQHINVSLPVLQNHWETWITEDDFIAIAAAGLNHVRIPLGYWSIPLTSADTNYTTSVSPYITGAWPYFLQALEWAKTHFLNVIVDLHGAPGSQNGYDNSGQRISSPQWANEPIYVNRTLDYIRFLAKNLDGMLNVIELLNEPAAFIGGDFPDVLRSYWLDGYDVIREYAGGNIQVMISDGFLGVDSWTNFLTPKSTGAVMDTHLYQIFSDLELSRSFDEHIQFACSQIPTYTNFTRSNIWTVIGEWTTSPTDCTLWLNGRGTGSRWKGDLGSTPNQEVFGSCDGWTGSYANFSTSFQEFMRMYWEVQVQTGEEIQGWIYWTWKAENSDEWSYSKGIEGGWIPQNPTDRMYPDICSNYTSA